MLFVWARGVVFARLNHIPWYTSSWWGIRPGAFLRREQRKRLYWNYFTETTFLKKLELRMRFRFGKVSTEPRVQKFHGNGNRPGLFVFESVIRDNDLFGELRTHTGVILGELNQIITPKIKKLVREYPAPVIGIHIRRGDFKIANPITSNEFFIMGINSIREATGSMLPVTVFTDADKNEIEDILALPETYMAAPAPDIVDILLLSKSKIMLLSQSSSFSYWGAFLSNAVVVRPAGDWQTRIKNDDAQSGYTEIKWDYTDENSTKEFIKQISKSRIS